MFIEQLLDYKYKLYEKNYYNGWNWTYRFISHKKFAHKKMKCKVTNHIVKPFMSFGKMPLANGFLKKEDFVVLNSIE